eukprot:11022673-Alexandrium_andersonii.AAC.1
MQIRVQIPSRGEGRLARRASWDCDLPGWILGSGPVLTRGLKAPDPMEQAESGAPHQAQKRQGRPRAADWRTAPK